MALACSRVNDVPTWWFLPWTDSHTPPFSQVSKKMFWSPLCLIVNSIVLSFDGDEAPFGLLSWCNTDVSAAGLAEGSQDFVVDTVGDTELFVVNCARDLN